MTANGAALSKIKKKLLPAIDGQDVLRIRSAVVAAIAADGTTTITLSGASIAGVSVLDGAAFAVGSVVQVLSYRGSLLVIGAASTNSAQPARLNSTDNLNGTPGTTFTNTLGTTSPAIFGVAFVGPPSGKVLVMGRCLAGCSAVNGYSFLDFEIKTGATIGSGSTFRGPNDLTCSVFQSSTANQQGTVAPSDLVTGLVPGDPYNAALVYRVGSGTGLFNRRWITVLPQ